MWRIGILEDPLRITRRRREIDLVQNSNRYREMVMMYPDSWMCYYGPSRNGTGSGPLTRTFVSWTKRGLYDWRWGIRRDRETDCETKGDPKLPKRLETQHTDSGLWYTSSQEKKNSVMVSYSQDDSSKSRDPFWLSDRWKGWYDT